jgi:hypothetical protein
LRSISQNPEGETQMNMEEVIKNLDMCFTSGNEIPVSRATIKREEWEVIKDEFNNLRNIIDYYKERISDYQQRENNE